MEKVSLSNKVFTENPLLDEIIYNIRQMAVGLIVKDEDRANYNESLESIKTADIFIFSNEGRAKFENFIYDYDLIREAIPSITDEEAQYFADHNDKIPVGIRPVLLGKAIEKYLDNYLELNNYYRMINGEPFYDPTGIYEGLWVDASKIDINYPVPFEYISKFKPSDGEYELIHTLNLAYQNILFSNGTCENIVNNEDFLTMLEMTKPEVEYLLHIGDRKVDYYTARKCPKFGLLYCPKPTSELVERRFRDLYEANRLYTLYTVYSEAYKYRSDYYDNFMMIFITIQTMIDMIIELPEYIIRRDVFDTRTCQYIFESNGVKYFRDIPLKYQIALVKNLNRLLKFKSTDKCLVDIVSLFGITDIQIFRHYILRDRLVESPTVLGYLDEEKEVTDEEGNINTVKNNDINYDLKFVKVPINGNYDDYIREENNIEAYDDIVNGDEYWTGDKNYNIVKSDIKNLDFTVLRSKYYTVEAIIDLTKRNFTLVYFMNILMYNDIDKSRLLVNIPSVSTTKKFELVDVIISLFSLGYIYYGAEDLIMDSRKKIAQVLGFNMDADLSKIASWLHENHRGLKPKDLHIENFISSKSPDWGGLMDFNQLQDIYFNNKDIYDHVTYMLTNPPTKDIYDAYKYIYNALFTMNLNMEYFILGDNPIIDQYKSLGYQSKFIYIPQESEYTNPEDYQRDYRWLLESIDEHDLCFEPSHNFTEDHLLNIYIKRPSNNESELLKIGEAIMAYTYREYLQHKEPALYVYLENIAQMIDADARQEACINAIQVIISYLKDYINQNGDEYINLDHVFSNLPSISIDFIKKYVEEVVDFFKSFKIFTHESSILYLIQDKFENYVKLIDKILLKYLLDKSELVKIEDIIEGKVESVSGLLLNIGNGIGVSMEEYDTIKMIDKVWFNIDTWIQLNYEEYYDSDRYKELTKRIKDISERYSTLESNDYVFPDRWIKDAKIYASDAIVNMVIDIYMHSQLEYKENIHMEETREFEEYYNEWVADIAIILATLECDDKVNYQDDIIATSLHFLDTTIQIFDMNSSKEIEMINNDKCQIMDTYYSIITSSKKKKK